MLKFYHAPWSRSSSVLWLLEELGVPYEIELIDFHAEGGVPEAYRQIQPNKKVPAIVHDGLVVTERAAITIYLADRFPEAGLAPALDHPDRAAYLTTLVYCDSVIDPVICADVQHFEYTGNQFPFGTFDDMVAYLERRLTAQPFAAGASFTAADTQLASTIGYTMSFMKALPEKTVFKEYLARIADRPAHRRAAEKDQALTARIPFLANAAKEA